MQKPQRFYDTKRGVFYDFELRSTVERFEALYAGKNLDVRAKNWDFKPGHLVRIREWDEGGEREYTGRTVMKRVAEVVDNSSVPGLDWSDRNVVLIYESVGF